MADVATGLFGLSRRLSGDVVIEDDQIPEIAEELQKFLPRLAQATKGRLIIPGAEKVRVTAKFERRLKRIK